MQIIINEDDSADIRYDYPAGYSADIFKGSYTHEELAECIADHKLKTYMVSTVADHLANEHWDNPEYMHKTNHIIACEGLQAVRRILMNKYYSKEELEALMVKHNLPTKEFNYREDEGRGFKFRIEDELFHYQETMVLLEFMEGVLESAKYKVDAEGYLVEGVDGDEEEYVLETDPEAVERNKAAITERYIIPRIQTSHDRVYNMPTPFSHWDYRSSWHQGFFVEIPSENITLVYKGGSGSSGAREHNGRWAHTFGLLASKYGIETPTFFMRYDKNNVWREEFRIDTFATLGRDLSGNYYSTRDIMVPLFKDRVYDLRDEGNYCYVYEKRNDGIYY